MKKDVFKLRKKFANNWITALRSGKYKQIDAQLRKEVDGEMCYCALGVACVAMDIKISQDGKECNGGNENGNGYDALRKHIPGDLINQIYKLNDCDKLTLPEIADWIEANTLIK